MKSIKFIAIIAFLALACVAAGQNAEPTWLVRRAKPTTPPAFDSLIIGETTRDSTIATLGAPTGEKDRVLVWRDNKACRIYSLYRIAIRYDEKGIIEELELALKRPLEPWIAENELRLDRPTERTDVSRDASVPAERFIYADAGVRFLVARERVVAIQLFLPTAKSTADLRRRIRVTDLRCLAGSYIHGRTGISVSATVQTDGCAGQLVTARTRLRTQDGQPIRTTDSTESFRFFAEERAEFEWGDLFFVELFVPYNLLDLQVARRGPMILTLEAECVNLVSCAETITSLPPTRDPLVLPQIRITEQYVTASPEHVQVVVETDRLHRQTMTAQLAVREAGTGESRDVGDAQAETQHEFGDVQDFKIALNEESMGATDKPIVLHSMVECGRLRAIAEMECVFIALTEGDDKINTEQNLTCSIEVIQPVDEMLVHPYNDRLDSRPHTLPFEVQVQGLSAGLRSLRLAIDGAGERTLWCQVADDETIAVFRGEVPLPPGPYRVTLSLPDATTIPPITLEGKLPEYPYAPTKEDLDEWIAYVAGWQECKKEVAVAWGLCNLGRDYYLLGMLNEAQETLDKAINIYSRGGEALEQLHDAYRILTQIQLLRGDTAALNAAYKRWMQSEPKGDELASVTFEWAQSLALLETDLSDARRLWKDVVRYTSVAGIDIPPTPPWANGQLK